MVYANGGFCCTGLWSGTGGAMARQTFDEASLHTLSAKSQPNTRFSLAQ